MEITTFIPHGGDLLVHNPEYQSFVAQFARASNVILDTKESIDPDLNPKDDIAVKNVTQFVLWTRTISPEQWKQGIQLNKAQVYDVCGQPAHIGYAALKACLKKIRSGNRKKGESDTWGISVPHLRGLLKFIARNAALKAATAALEMEALELRIKQESELESLISAPVKSQFELDNEWAEQQRLKALKTPLLDRVKPHADALKYSAPIKISVGGRDMEPLSDDAPDNWARLERDGI